jgi:uncharacterized metal-binding protein YceD (DUF177 family)
VKLDLRTLPEGHSTVERRLPPPAEDWSGWFRPEGETRVVLDVDRRGHLLTIRGHAEAAAGFPCARCAAPVTRALVAPLMVVAERAGSDAPEEQAALEQEGSILYHDGLEVDLSEPLREAVILEVPQVVLCRPDCKGLCPTCGADRNEGACGCSPVEGDPRWDALKQLKDSSQG